MLMISKNESRFEVLSAVHVKITVFLDVVPCSAVASNLRSRPKSGSRRV